MRILRNIYVTIGVLMLMLALSMDISWYSPAQVELERQAYFIQAIMLICGLNFMWFGSHLNPVHKIEEQEVRHDPSIYDVTPYGFKPHQKINGK